MRKIQMVLALAAILSAQSMFAHKMMGDSKACAAIATACSNAGFTRAENTDKKFWHDCMKPIMLGQSVQGVTIDAAISKECRTDKINALKKQIDELQKIPTNK